jgi:hypothetical protein
VKGAARGLIGRSSLRRPKCEIAIRPARPCTTVRLIAALMQGKAAAARQAADLRLEQMRRWLVGKVDPGPG